MTEARDTAGVIAPPPLLALAAVIIGLALDWLLPAYVLSILLDLTDRIVIGAILIAAGAALGVSAIGVFRAAGTHVEPWKPSTALATQGIFNWLRNPMYVGATLLLTGLAVLLASDWMLVMTAVFAVVVHFGVVKREERYLEAKFGDAYRRYCAAVPRYGIPL
jgi:protein-S-isoprenylcysteine O-methyltransferase Ste14